MRNGQLGNLQGIVITLIIVGVVLGVGFYVMAEIQEQESLAKSESDKITNETLSSNVTEAGVYVTKYAKSNFEMDTTIVCFTMNQTGVPYLLPTSNYTATSAGLISFTAENISTAWNNTQWNCTYAYTFAGSVWEHINKTGQAVSKIPTWLTILVIVAIVGVVLSILFGLFPGMGGGSVLSGAGKGLSRIKFGKGGGPGTAEI